MKNNVCIFVIGPNNEKLMPTTRAGKVYRMLKSGLAEVVYTIPFTIRLKYEPKTKITQNTTIGIDPGRTNIGVAVVREDGKCLYRAHLTTRNKQIPKLMEKRKEHRHASRRGERLKRKRRAKKNRTIMKNEHIDRLLPGYSKPVRVKDIKNTEAKFINRKVPKGWLTPTATHLLRTHINLINKVKKILPITNVCVEINKFAFMALDNPNVKKKDIDFQRGPLYGYSGLHDAIHEMQHGMCLLCNKTSIEHYHHMIPRSKNGSDTLANVVGLCAKCHEKVHKNEKSKQKLNVLHTKLYKKYGALSVLNQIIPYLVDKLSEIFLDHLYVTWGYYTKQTRKRLGLVKNHDIDAYCIAIQSFYEDHVRVDTSMPTIHEIVQFRRQDRAKIHCQHERTYKLDKTTVAKNRRKRTDQFDDSLHEWYLKTKDKLGVIETKRLQSKLRVIKSKSAYNNLNRVMPGSVFEFEGKLYVMCGQSKTGGYYSAFNYKDVRFPIRKCKNVIDNGGLVYIF